MKPAPGKIALAYSVADQSFARTKSIGILNYSTGLMEALARQTERVNLTLLANHSLVQSLNLPPQTKVEFHDHAGDSGLGRAKWDQWGVYSAARATGADWLLLPKGFASFARPCPLRLAVIVHDLMHEHYKRHHPGWGGKLEGLYFDASLQASLHRAQIVFTQSEFVKSEMEAFIRQKNYAPARVVCAGIGFTRWPSPAPAPAPRRDDLVVLASRVPHKLTPRALEFMTRWQQETRFPGATHWIGSFPEGLTLPRLPGWIHHPRLPEAEFRERIQQARVVLFFSEYEGFGMPVVEAVLAGACPVYSDIAATREVMGGRGGPFDNANYESFARALQQALATLPETLATWAENLLARYNWDVVADRVITALAETR